MILQAVACELNGEKAKALQLLSDCLALAEPGGFIRIFVEEGPHGLQVYIEDSVGFRQ